MLSRAAKHEREAKDDLDNAAALIFRASVKLRGDSAAKIMAGKLSAATLIIEDVSKQVNDRTKEF